MSPKKVMIHGCAIPDHSRHSVTVNQPTWKDCEDYGNDPPAVMATWQNAYPRLKTHPDIVQLGIAALRKIDMQEQACLLFGSLQTARECLEFATSATRNDGKNRSPVALDQISIRAFKTKDRFYALVFPTEKVQTVFAFWKITGMGISSRFAEVNLRHLDNLAEVNLDEPNTVDSFGSDVHGTVRQRIVYHLGRSPLDIPQKQPSTDDVYFFPSGMAAIYKPHTYLSKKRPGVTVLFGMSFLSTIILFDEYGGGSEFFGLGTDEDISRLEHFLEEERSHGRHVQAIWTEYPSNPLLLTPDLARLRALADQYDTVLAVDSTISSFANVDILHIVDFLTASLTKSFNGYADVISGGAILNPNSKRYTELKTLFDENHVPEFHISDMEVMERNSRDYIERTIKLNANAAALVDFLQSCVRDPGSSVCKVYYPGVNSSKPFYQQYMRPATAEFTPGYGCLFSFEFETLACIKAFYDAINLYKTPHLGAPWTLLFAYTVTSYSKKLDWAAQYGLKPTQIRISAGLEDTDILIEEFKIALRAADEAWKSTPPLDGD